MNAVRSLDSGVFFTEVALRAYDVRGLLILGAARALVWDTLSRPRDMAGYLPVIGNRDLTIAYSHADWDHIWGTAGLPYQQAVILGHRSCLERFGQDVPETLREMRAAEPGSWDDVELIAPTQVFDDEVRIDLGSMTVTLHHLPGHTRDCCVAFVPERGLLLMGDTAETPFPVVPHDAPLEQWIAGLERWECDPRVRTVVPAHGATGGRAILRNNIRYLQGLRDGRPLDPIDVAGPLTPFYRATHESNLRQRGRV
jgi:glyoxylase-like metal-dependent hydrolase (beta-lactamase superfamily II)